MRNPQIQMDLLPDYRDPSGPLQYALARERRQENNKKWPTQTDHSEK